MNEPEGSRKYMISVSHKRDYEMLKKFTSMKKQIIVTAQEFVHC